MGNVFFEGDFILLRCDISLLSADKVQKNTDFKQLSCDIILLSIDAN